MDKTGWEHEAAYWWWPCRKDGSTFGLMLAARQLREWLMKDGPTHVTSLTNLRDFTNYAVHPETEC